MKLFPKLEKQDQPQAKRQKTVTEIANPFLPFLTLTKEQQDYLNDNAVRYIVKKMLPLNTIEDPDFRIMITSPFANAKILTRATLSERIVQRYAEMTQNLIKRLSSINYTCSAFDIWSSSNRSFLGIVESIWQFDLNGQTQSSLR